METVAGHEHNFLLVSILPQKLTDEVALIELRELKALVEAYGGVVKDLVVQRREAHDKGMYVGKGKLEEIVEVVQREKIDVVVLNGMIKPGHIHTMKNTLAPVNMHIQVWDRIDLILKIFDNHAHSAEAKLQIEMASMKHMGPRIYGMGLVLSRQGGGVGTRGVGETNTELMKRHWQDQMKKVQEKIQKHTKDREQQLSRRSRNGIQTVSIIGYTNAGKTSLFNKISGKKNIVQNALFVTLDSSTGKIYLPTLKKEVILTDTIGFIRNLPHSLIDAFRSTLMESIYADILLCVIDVSDDEVHTKIQVIEDVLSDLRLINKKRIYVFNKIDAGSKIPKKDLLEEYGQFTPQFISVKNNEGIQELLGTVEQALSQVSQGEQNQEYEFKPRRSKRIHV